MLLSLRLQGDPTSPSQRKSVLNIHWKDWSWRGNCNTLAIWCKEPTYWKRPWCWERLKAVGEGDGRGWDGWMASLMQWTWVWVGFWNWWWIGKPGVLQSTGSPKVTPHLSDWIDLRSRRKREKTIGNISNNNGWEISQINVRHQTIDSGSSETISRINVKKKKRNKNHQSNPRILRTINFQAMDNQIKFW